MNDTFDSKAKLAWISDSLTRLLEAAIVAKQHERTIDNIAWEIAIDSCTPMGEKQQQQIDG